MSNVRLIDANALIRTACEKFYTTNYYSHILEMIDNAPTIEPKQEWIPCSERLPEYRETVLISTYWGVRIADRDSVKEDGTDDFWHMFLEDATAKPMYVYAWQPLPEPYQPKERSEE